MSYQEPSAAIYLAQLLAHRGDFKTALLQAIWVCAHTFPLTDTHTHAYCPTYKYSFSLSTQRHTAVWQRVRLFLCLLHQTGAKWLRRVQVDRWECHWGADAEASERNWWSQQTSDSDEGESGDYPPPPHPNINSTLSTARSREVC